MPATECIAVNESTSTSAAGRYLSFKLGAESYGISILKIQEIIGLMTITFVPRMPEFVRGVINLRGRVIPIINLRNKFGMESCEDTERTCVVVVQIPQGNTAVILGLIVDEVCEVLNINASQIEPPPLMGNSNEAEFILGMGKIGDKVIMLLDVDRAITSEEILLVSQ